jgi:hypothetical protein
VVNGDAATYGDGAPALLPCALASTGLPRHEDPHGAGRGAELGVGRPTEWGETRTRRR